VSDAEATAQGRSGKRLIIVVMAALTAFLAYSSVYAYRKPFTVATFDGLRFWNISYQTLLIISQVIGYMLSKFCGIKFIAELKSLGRFRTGIILTMSAWLCLFLFALLPAPWGMLPMFINGFLLGFMWGVVFSYIEGRRATDLIGAVMAVSFIFAGGFTRTVGKWLMVEWNVAENWMPFFTGLVFIIPLVFFLWMLERIPPPDEDDRRERTIRTPMNAADRKVFLKQFGVGLIIASATYLFLTVMRDIRDNYMANIWNELGHGSDYSVFTRTETNTSLLVLLIMGMLVLVRKNIRAFALVHVVILAGFLIAGISSALFINGMMDGALWMQLVSLGLYMGYIPFNCIFFERLIATFRISGNVGFLIYFADAFGYLGSVTVMLIKEFIRLKLNWSEFYSYGVVIGSVLGVAGVLFSYRYFKTRYNSSRFVS
jgi:MFS family permease